MIAREVTKALDRRRPSLQRVQSHLLATRPHDADGEGAVNGWSSHGIDHVSPSQINLMANEPAMWDMEYMLDRKVPRGARAVRGIVVEMAVVAVHRDN